MKTLQMILNEASKTSQMTLNEAETPKSVNRKKPTSNSLLVILDLSQIEKETLDSLFDDYSIDWANLGRRGLRKLFNLFKPAPMLDFSEWMEANEWDNLPYYS